jgi:hypothetical protein
MRIPLGAPCVILLCISSSTVNAHDQPWKSHGTHKGNLYGRPHDDLADRRAGRKPRPGSSSVCEPAYDLVFRRTVCIDPRYNF